MFNSRAIGHHSQGDATAAAMLQCHAKLQASESERLRLSSTTERIGLEFGLNRCDGGCPGRGHPWRTICGAGSPGRTDGGWGAF